MIDTMQATADNKKFFSKTRAWNLFFWIAMSAGMGLAAFLKHALDSSPLAAFFMVLSVVAVALALIIFNNTSNSCFGFFLDNEGLKIDKKSLPNPSMFGWILFLTIPANIFAIFGILTSGVNPDVTFALGFSVFLILFSIISMYFIFKNCPISILFNRRFWAYINKNSEPYVRKDDPNTDSSYSFLSTNLFNKHRSHR